MLDNKCTKRVWWTSWWNIYLKKLSAEDRKKVAEKESSAKFKFGDG